MTVKIGGSADNRALGQQLWAADRIELVAEGHRFYWKAQFLREITKAAADTLIDRFPSVPSPRSFFVFQQVGGAIGRVPRAATAYANRDAAYDTFPVSIWTDPAADVANMAWAREMYGALRPFAMEGVYVNNLGSVSLCGAESSRVREGRATPSSVSRPTRSRRGRRCGC